MKKFTILLRYLVCAWIGYCIHNCLSQGRPTAAAVCAFLLAFLIGAYFIIDHDKEKTIDEVKRTLDKIIKED